MIDPKQSKVRRSEPGEAVSSHRIVATLVALAVLALGVIVLRLFAGEPFHWPDSQILQVRLFRVVLACLVGVALASSGVALQTLLRNPLAEPFILGLSTGATVGLLLLRWLGPQYGHAMVPQHVGAVVGAVASALVVYFASRRHGVLDPLGLLLVGVVLSTINGAIIMLLHYMLRGPSPPIEPWMMGHLDEGLDGATVWSAAATILISFVVLVVVAPSMDVATFSDDEAQSLGVNLARLRRVLFAVASLLAGAAVILAGPLAFVGFVCPHLGRLVLGPTHRILLFASALIGAVMILLSDVVIVCIDARWNTGQLPMGIFTAVVGGMVFLWMLRSNLKRPEG